MGEEIDLLPFFFLLHLLVEVVALLAAELIASAMLASLVVTSITLTTRLLTTVHPFFMEWLLLLVMFKCKMCNNNSYEYCMVEIQFGNCRLGVGDILSFL